MSANKLYKKVEAFLADSKEASYKLQKAEQKFAEQLVKSNRAFYSKDYEHIALYKECYE